MRAILRAYLSRRTSVPPGIMYLKMASNRGEGEKALPHKLSLRPCRYRRDRLRQSGKGWEGDILVAKCGIGCPATLVDRAIRLVEGGHRPTHAEVQDAL